MGFERATVCGDLEFTWSAELTTPLSLRESDEIRKGDAYSAPPFPVYSAVVG